VAGRVVLAKAQHRELESLFSDTFLDPAVIDRVVVRDPAPTGRHRFAVGAVDGREPDRGVADAIRPVLDVLPDVRSVWCVWRLTPAGPSSGPVPHRLVLVGVGPGGFAPATAYRVEYALRRAGMRASVEVLVDGNQPGDYHQEAMRCARQVPFAEPDSGNRPRMSPVEPVRAEPFEPPRVAPAQPFAGEPRRDPAHARPEPLEPPRLEPPRGFGEPPQALGEAPRTVGDATHTLGAPPRAFGEPPQATHALEEPPRALGEPTRHPAEAMTEPQRALPPPIELPQAGARSDVVHAVEPTPPVEPRRTAADPGPPPPPVELRRAEPAPVEPTRPDQPAGSDLPAPVPLRRPSPSNADAPTEKHRAVKPGSMPPPAEQRGPADSGTGSALPPPVELHGTGSAPPRPAELSEPGTGSALPPPVELRRVDAEPSGGARGEHSLPSSVEPVAPEGPSVFAQERAPEEPDSRSSQPPSALRADTPTNSRPAPRRRAKPKDGTRPRLNPAGKDNPGAFGDDILNTQERSLLRELQDELARREQQNQGGTSSSTWFSRHGKSGGSGAPTVVNGVPPQQDGRGGQPPVG
jgi:hypothetical protein